MIDCLWFRVVCPSHVRQTTGAPHTLSPINNLSLRHARERLFDRQCGALTEFMRQQPSSMQYVVVHIQPTSLSLFFRRRLLRRPKSAPTSVVVPSTPPQNNKLMYLCLLLSPLVSSFPSSPLVTGCSACERREEREKQCQSTTYCAGRSGRRKTQRRSILTSCDRR